MELKKKRGIFKYLLISFFILSVISFLVYKDQLKITVVNSFSEVNADSLAYHVLDKTEKDIKSFNELKNSDKKTIVFVNSSWCSMCDILSTKLKENLTKNPEYIVYEADLDDFRIQLSEYKVSTSQKLIVLGKNGFKVINTEDIDLVWSQIQNAEI